MRKTRITALILLLALAAAILSGCHGTMDQNAAKEGYISEIPLYLDETKKIELTFWAKNDTNKVQTAVYTDAIAEFQKLYPNVTINIRLYADYGRIFNDVITNIATDTTPNVCITYPDHIATYLTGSNTVAALDDLMADERFGLGGSEVRFDAPKQDEIVPEFLQECVIGDHTYAMPYMRSTEALYVNVDYVEKLGYEMPEIPTWDFIWEVSEKAMEKDADGVFKVSGQKVMIPFIYKSTDNMMISMLKQLDAPYSTPQSEILIFNDTTKEILKEIYIHGKSRAFSTFGISSYPGNFLNAGQCIFAIDSTAGATWMGCEAPMLDIHKEQVVPFRTKITVIPQYNPDQPKMISQGPSVCVFKKDNPQEVLASWLFVQYLLTNNIQLGYAETEGYLPVTLKAQTSEEYTGYLARKGEDNNEHYSIKIEASELLMNHTKDTFVTPVFNGSASLRSAAGQLIENTVKGARRNQEMNDAFIEKQFSDVESLYRLNQIGGNQEEQSIPTGSKVLLGVIAGVWVLIIAYKVWQKTKERKKN